MIAPHFFYTQPQFRATSPDVAKLRNVTEWTLDTPGASFALALDYYRFEAFATKKDRDAACGPTAHVDVRYVAATNNDLYREQIVIDDVACGHALDHPNFEEVVSPLFDAAMKRLIGDVVKRPNNAKGTIASAELLIARTRYSIAAEMIGEWIKFPVTALTLFEESTRDVTDRTIDWLNNRIMLTASPSLFETQAN